MKNSKIEWCHHTVNFWWGCEFARLEDGTLRQECVHCYAKRLAAFFSQGRATWGATGRRWIRANAAVTELRRLDASARRRGVRERVFINSMSDTFEERADLEQVRLLLCLAIERVTNLDVLLLTKRPGNVLRLVPMAWIERWPAHVWIGTTAGTQKAADEAVPELLKIPARVRFLSCEPLLGPVDLTMFTHGVGIRPDKTTYRIPGLDWVICGGESGAGARPMQAEWARALRDQCAAASVPFFFKQWGEWLGTNPPVRVGKTTAGRALEGHEHSEVPGA
jgi:protein gp37